MKTKSSVSPKLYAPPHGGVFFACGIDKATEVFACGKMEPRITRLSRLMREMNTDLLPAAIIVGH